MMHYREALRHRWRELINTAQKMQTTAIDSIASTQLDKTQAVNTEFELIERDVLQAINGTDIAAKQATLLRLKEYQTSLDGKKQNLHRKIHQNEETIRVLQAQSDDLLKQVFHRNLRLNYVFGEFLCSAFVSEVLGIKKGSVVRDKVTFTTPWGLRRLDAYLVETKIALESKVGYQYLTRRLRIQIQKDAHLMKAGNLSSVYWLIHTGCSNSLTKELERNRIIVIKNWITDDVIKLFHTFTDKQNFIREYFR